VPSVRAPKGENSPFHAMDYLPAFDLAASQSFWVISLKPWPLHEFWPFQEFFSLLQEDCPLHELTPSQ
jgi:hypothetical protein